MTAVEERPRPADLLAALGDRARSAVLRPAAGRVVRVLGPVVRATDPGVHIGELCRLVEPRSGRRLDAEVVGLADGQAVLTPIGDMAGFSGRTEVRPTGRAASIQVGPDLLGRVVDGFGRDLEARAPRGAEGWRWRPVRNVPPSPLDRGLVDTPMPLGVRALDGLVSFARGQRMGVFGEPGAGKSQLLGQMVRGAAADAVVVALIGERGREVRDFLERQLDPGTLHRTTVVVATSDRPALERVRAAHTATAIAEAFRDEGRQVLLLMDSVTRYARALREIGLAAGEPPTRMGYPPSVFAELPQLFERAGPAPVGAISAVYTVLVEGIEEMDPIAEETRSLLDGHVILSSRLAASNHYPAIDILRSRSRVMADVATPEHLAAAGRFRELMARYDEVDLLVRVGEYKPGNDPLADEAIVKRDRMRAFLRQGLRERSSWEETLAALREIAK